MTQPQEQERKAYIHAGSVLRSLREKHGFSQEYLAERVGCDTKSIQRWEHGEGVPQPAYRRKLAEVFDMKVEEIVTLFQKGGFGSGNTSSPPEGILVQPESPEVETVVEHASIFWYQAQFSRSQEFYGREREQATLKSNIRRGISTSIVGPRRIGKTWLLNYIQEERPIQFCMSSLDATLPSCTTQEGFVAAVLEDLEAVEKRAQPLISFPPGRGLIELEKCVRRLRNDNFIPLLCIDEFEEFCKHPLEFPSGFFTQLRAVAQRGLVLVTASRTPLIDVVKRSGQTSPFFNALPENMFGRKKRGGVPDEETRFVWT